MSIRDRDRSFIARRNPDIPLVLTSASGAILIDESGQEFVDLTSGWNVMNLGWQNPLVMKAVQAQTDILSFVPSWCSHKLRVDLAQQLCGLLNAPTRVLCCCTGSEAIEAAIKVARLATKRHGVLSFRESYHGSTLGSLLAGGITFVEGQFLPSDELHKKLPLPYATEPTDWVTRVVSCLQQRPLPAAILLEAIFTNPGIIAASKEAYQHIVKTARDLGVVVICDEIGTGCGRTGHMFAFQHFDIYPDIVVVGKALSSGFGPISAAIVSEELAHVVPTSVFDSTYAWIPPMCAAALETLRIIQSDGIAERAMDLGMWAKTLLSSVLLGNQSVRAVRGWGLEIGIDLQDGEGNPLSPSQRREIRYRLLNAGVFAEFSRFTSTLIIMPPLTIEKPLLETAIGVVSGILHEKVI